MSNNRIKILAMCSFITLVTAILSFAPNVVVNADGDEFVKEIASYKNWTKINKEPIKATNQIDGSLSKQKVFIVDGQEVIGFRPGTFG